MSLYRKYRPQKFIDLIGQDHVRQILTNALATGQFSHAYLFAGSKGSGKTSTARLLAKALNCTGRELGPNSVEPCNKCKSCQEITLGHSLDVVEIDAASNRGIDEIRELRDKIRFAPTSSRFKIYVIDECHMLTKEAFNALLKTLEEPPPHAIFILATTELHKVLPTILSRVQTFDFRKARHEEIMLLLSKIVKQEKILIEDEALGLLSQLAYGAYRDAVSMLDQVASLGWEEQKTITLLDVQKVLGQTTEKSVWDLVGLISEKDRAAALKLVEEIYFEGRDLEHFTFNVIGVFRKIILAKNGLINDFEKNTEEGQKVLVLAEKFSSEELIAIIDKFLSVATMVKSSAMGQLPLEMAIFELTQGQPSVSLPNEKKDEPKVEKNQHTQQDKPALCSAPVIQKSSPKPKNIEPAVKEDIVKLWSEVVKEIKAHNNTLAAMLKEASLSGVEDEKIILTFKFKFHAEKTSENKNLSILESTIAKISRKNFKIECLVDPNMAVKKPVDHDEELLDAAKEIFDLDE